MKKYNTSMASCSPEVIKNPVLNNKELHQKKSVYQNINILKQFQQI